MPGEGTRIIVKVYNQEILTVDTVGFTTKCKLLVSFMNRSNFLVLKTKLKTERPTNRQQLRYHQGGNSEFGDLPGLQTSGSLRTKDFQPSNKKSQLYLELLLCPNTLEPLVNGGILYKMSVIPKQ